MAGNRMQMQIPPGQQMNPNMGMLGQVGGPGQIMPGQIMQGQQRGPAPPYMNPSPGETLDCKIEVTNKHIYYRKLRKVCFYIIIKLY